MHCLSFSEHPLSKTKWYTCLVLFVYVFQPQGRAGRGVLADFTERGLGMKPGHVSFNRVNKCGPYTRPAFVYSICLDFLI